MAGKLLHWKEKDGRFYARIAVPKRLKPFLGKSELIEPLGADRRAAMRLHHGAVDRLQARIVQAERTAATAGAVTVDAGRFALTADQIAVSHYNQRLAFDDILRNEPGYSLLGIDDRLVSALREGALGRLTDAELVPLVGREIERFRAAGNLTAEVGSDEWRRVARALCSAELEALERVVERDEGDFTGQLTTPMMLNAMPPDDAPVPTVPLKKLFEDYIATRQAIGKHRDGGANWESVITGLIKFLGHGDARKITRRNLLDWRDSLMASGKSAKTVSDKHIAAVSAVLRWAFENDRLPTNEAETVRQEVPKKAQLREKGYTTAEAVKVLRASLSHQPKETNNPSNRESAHVTAAKRWVPLLCAFTGARVTEMTQLRKQDLRQENDRWILRITPEAGSVKTGQYRDVPLHRQAVALGFIDFVSSAKDGPLFHGAKSPDRYVAGSTATSGKLSQWLNELELVPAGVQPSYGWRHRFKTQGLELGASDRVLNGIQGHPGKTASDGYGDVTIAAKLKIIDALPDYDLSD